MDEQEARERVARVEALIDDVEALGDPRARDKALEVVQALLELYGEGLARMMAHVEDADELAEDELVSHLLVIHGLHPISLEQRVHGALEEVRPYLGSHGGGVEIVGIDDGIVRLRLQGSCEGCPSSTMTLKLAIEEAILKAAPEVEGVEAEGAVEAAPSGIPLPMAGSGVNGASAEPEVEGSWAIAGGLPQLAGGGTLLREVAGEPMLFLSLDGTFYAYRPGCPGCGDSLEGAPLEAGELACPSCGHRYDARRAGRCLDAPKLHLEPIPLLMGDSGVVKVAVAAVAAA